MADYTLTQTGEQIQSDLNKVESLANIKSIGSGLSLNSAGQLSATGGGSGAVSSVNGKTGAVVLTASDIDAGGLNVAQRLNAIPEDSGDLENLGGLVIPDGETRTTNELVSINSSNEQEQIAIGSGLSVTTGSSGKKTLSASSTAESLYQHNVKIRVNISSDDIALVTISFISKNSEVLNTKEKLVDELTRCSLFGKYLISNGVYFWTVGESHYMGNVYEVHIDSEQYANVIYYTVAAGEGTSKSKSISDSGVTIQEDSVYQIK